MGILLTDETSRAQRPRRSANHSRLLRSSCIFLYGSKELMDLIEAIDTRSSAGRVGEPGPIPEHLDLILNAARRAPAQGVLRRCPLIVLEGSAKGGAPAAAAEAKRRRIPALTDEQVTAD